MSVGYHCRESGKIGRTKYYIIHTIQYYVWLTRADSADQSLVAPASSVHTSGSHRTLSQSLSQQSLSTVVGTSRPAVITIMDTLPHPHFLPNG